MNEDGKTIFDAKNGLRNSGLLTESIFPPFSVNVPMPSGTAVPPVVVITPAPSAEPQPTPGKVPKPDQV